MIFTMKGVAIRVIAMALSVTTILGVNASPAPHLPGPLEARAALSGCDQGDCPDGDFGDFGFDVVHQKGAYTYRYEDSYGGCHPRKAQKFASVIFDTDDGTFNNSWADDPNYVYFDNTLKVYKFEKKYQKLTCSGGDVELWWPGELVSTT
ncbi:hypothetical protein VHEMI09092 [[Torrubiella] hemipterigena]|uniref:Uncharacterized protein n=1 Tax=[Torrubiella] hemipterigena TaxID=1531966 RepID=A0A0A1TPE3_9HYPO|nr:hypothetical protein VHEMI09092 [[Torrubiella] hemipterigena]